jgi:acetyl-CoA acyltransferase
MADVYVIGADMIRFGRFEDATPPQLSARAALMALDDAGLAVTDMEAVYSGNCGETMVG